MSAPLQITVRKPDLVVTAFSATSSTTVDAGQAITLTWTVANQAASLGTAYQPWHDRVWLSTDNTFGGDSPLGLLTHSTDLAAGTDYTVASFNETISTALAAGTYYLFLQTDTFSLVAEEDESNNVSAPLQITVRKPDLTPTALAVPASAARNTQIAVSWTVTNSGDAQALQPWTDRIWLSTDNVLGGDTLLGGVTHTSDLAASGNYNENSNVTIPNGAATGASFIILETDTLGNVAESDESNNTTAQPITITP
ncbi:MAG: hypothetical protein HY699_11435 [Deltaproteobacteria bacterium]|nr:hypothetical protein [Deltaproteobacteria bacterium]